MNLSGIGSLLGVATSLLGGAANPAGGAGSLVSSLLGGGGSTEATGTSNDPFAAIMNLTHEADSLATGGLGSFLGGALLSDGASSLLGSIAGTLA